MESANNDDNNNTTTTTTDPNSYNMNDEENSTSQNDNNNNASIENDATINDSINDNYESNLRIKTEITDDDEDGEDEVDDDDYGASFGMDDATENSNSDTTNKDVADDNNRTADNNTDSQASGLVVATSSSLTTSTSISTMSTTNQTNLCKAGVIRVQESDGEGSESIELELESDNSLLLTSLTSLFPDATGLKYRHPETNTLRGVKLVDGRFIQPSDGWSSTYICVFNRGAKRKNDSNNEHEESDASNSRAKQVKTDIKGAIAGNGSDLVVLGLPWTTTEETMKNYFEQYGEVSMVQVKTDPKSGKSRGFGFVRFTKSSIQNKLLSMRHFIDGRWCDVRIPLSKAEAEATRAQQLSRKIFVGRLPDDITTDDLRNHFSEYGTLTDVFIPKPFRNFAFVTFGTSDMAQSIFKHKHVIKGSQVQISEAIPRDTGTQNFGNNFASGPQQNSNNYGNSGYSANNNNNNNNIHPFNSNYNPHQASHHFHNKGNFAGANFGANLYPNARKMHPQSTYYQMPTYGSSGPSSSVDSSNYVNHNAHNDYTTFGGGGAPATSSYNQQATSVNGGQYYKIQQPIITPNQTHSTYPNQSSYSSNHGANFSRNSYGSVWK